jgi:hypothetical protein
MGLCSSPGAAALWLCCAVPGSFMSRLSHQPHDSRRGAGRADEGGSGAVRCATFSPSSAVRPGRGLRRPGAAPPKGAKSIKSDEKVTALGRLGPPGPAQAPIATSCVPIMARPLSGRPRSGAWSRPRLTGHTGQSPGRNPAGECTASHRSP